MSSQRASPLKGFELLTLPGTPEESEAPPDEDSAPLDASLDTRGLHAKLLWAEHAAGATLWLGSPNLTQRAWTRNAEAFAEIGVRLRGGAQAARALHEGLETFRNMARPVDLEDLENETPEDDDREALEVARRQVAARLCARQRHDAKGTTIVEALEQPPHPEDPRISLSVGQLGGAMVQWVRDTINVALPKTDASADADLISVRVSLNDQFLSWTQLAPFDPPLPPARDAAMLREYVGALGVLSWIRDVLEDSTGSDGGGPWDKKPPRRPRTRRPRAPTATGVPTVEQVLRAWMRDPARLDSVDRILRTLAMDTSTDTAEDDAEARRHLEAFSRSWKTLRTGLIGEGAPCPLNPNHSNLQPSTPRFAHLELARAPADSSSPMKSDSERQSSRAASSSASQQSAQRRSACSTCAPTSRSRHRTSHASCPSCPPTNARVRLRRSIARA